MKKNLTLYDLYEVNEVFEPSVFYPFDWFLTRDIHKDFDHFMANAKKGEKGNLYELFLEEEYYSPLIKYTGSKATSRALKPRIVSTDDHDEKGRGIYFSLYYMLMELLGERTPEFYKKFLITISEKKEPKELESILKEVLRNDRKPFHEIQRLGVDAAKYESAMAVYKKQESFLCGMSFDRFIEKQIETYINLSRALPDIIQLCLKKINTQKLIECFDYDKFCLCLMYSLLNASYETEKEQGTLDNSAYNMEYYIRAVESLKKSNPNYICRIKDCNEKGQVIEKTSDDFILEARKLFAKHPEFSIYEITDKDVSMISHVIYGRDNVDFSSKNNEMTLHDALKMLIESKDFSAVWEFLPKGSQIDDGKTYQQVIARVNTLEYDYHKRILPESEIIRKMLYAKNFLDNSEYLYRLKGINEFAGYICYIYSNGSVLFEQFYEDKKCTIISSNKATYAMSLYNFVEYSKLTKKELIKKAKYDKDVKRPYHTENMDSWANRIRRIIEGFDYTDKVHEYIGKLIDGQEVYKKLGTK